MPKLKGGCIQELIRGRTSFASILLHGRLEFCQQISHTNPRSLRLIRVLMRKT